MTMRYTDQKWIDVFWSRVNKMGPLHEGLGTRCWEWTGPTRHGYGSLSWRRGTGRAHRVSYELEHGPIPDGLHVLHRCDNRPCCNPAHLFLGTNDDNVVDKRTKGREWHPSGEDYHRRRRADAPFLMGERIGTAKMTSDKVIHLRRLSASGVAGADLAARFSISDTTVYNIIARRTWRHL